MCDTAERCHTWFPRNPGPHAQPRNKLQFRPMHHLLILTACGFYLRGSVTIPPYLKTIQLQDASPAMRIAPELERALRDIVVK